MDKLIKNDWENELKEAQANAGNATLKFCIKVAEFKESCENTQGGGEFTAKCMDWLGVKKSVVNMLAQVGSSSLLSDSVGKLPNSYATLSELIKLDENTYNSAISSGAINPNMTRADAKTLRGIVPTPSSTTPYMRMSRQLDKDVSLARNILHHLVISGTKHTANDYRALIPVKVEDNPKLALEIAKTIQRFYHPDKSTGDTELSAVANSFYDNLKKEVIKIGN